MRLTFLLLALVAAHAPTVQAQDISATPLKRADAWAAVGWHNARVTEAGEYDDWYHASAAGTLGTAWYWTDHLRTELDFGGTSRGEVYVYDSAPITNQTPPRFGWVRHKTRALGLTQHYQFFRNAWFHPYIGAGLDIVQATKDEHLEAVLLFDRNGRATQVVPASDERSRDVGLRAAASVGFKAYMSRRAYFRTDARLGVGRQIDDVVIRFGFGADF